MPIPPPTDSDVPALQILLGPDARDVVGTAVGEAGSDVEEIRVVSVRYIPGRSVTVQYRTTLRDASGSLSRPMIVASSGISIPDGAAAILESDETRISIWRFPHDPFLPGLPAATSATSAADLLTRLGAATSDVRIRTRAYRAGRRAVVQASGAGGTVFMKILRPSRIAALQQRHRELAPHLPIPSSLGWSREQGIVVMEALGGKTLRHSLEAGELELPSPQAISALLDQFPTPDGNAPVVRGAYQRAPEHARLLRAVLPASAGVLEELVAGVAVAGSEDPEVAVHGDFHGSQLLIESGRIVGLVDVDTAGRGQRADDMASILGQLATVGSMADNPAPFGAYNALLAREFERTVDPVSLRRRVAGVILGLATGPFRVQLSDWPEATRRRLALAAEWLESADDQNIPHEP